MSVCLAIILIPPSTAVGEYSNLFSSINSVSLQLVCAVIIVKGRRRKNVVRVPVLFTRTLRVLVQTKLLFLPVDTQQLRRARDGSSSWQ